MKAILVNRRPAKAISHVRSHDLWRLAMGIHGIEFEDVDFTDPHQFADIAFCWGMKSAEWGHARALKTVVTELGFLGDRLTNNYVGYCDLNGRGTPICGVIRGRGEPYYHLIKDQKKGLVKRVVLFGQVNHDTSLIPMCHDRELRVDTYRKWTDDVIRFLTSKGYEVGWRDHPQAGAHEFHNRKHGVRILDSMDEALDWADTAVAFSSNALVEAALSGLRVIPTSHTSMAWSIRSSLQSPRRLTYPEMVVWLDFVASNQWHRDEITAGIPLQHILGIK